MPVFKDKPDAPDRLSISQGDIQGNFEYLRESLDKEHLSTFMSNSTGTAQGRHTYISFSNSAAIPANKVRPANRTAVLFGEDSNIWYNGSSVLGNVVQLTNVNVVPTVAGGIGYTFLPGGLMLAYGQSARTGPLTTITFPNGGFTLLGVASLPLSINVTQGYDGSPQNLPICGINNATLSATSFTTAVSRSPNGGSSAGTPYHWMAIGFKT